MIQMGWVRTEGILDSEETTILTFLVPLLDTALYSFFFPPLNLFFFLCFPSASFGSASPGIKKLSSISGVSTIT